MTLVDDSLGFDLELDARGKITAIGAVLADAEFHRKDTRNPAAALGALDEFAAPAPFVFGHNILWHDLPCLARIAPHLHLLQKPAVDTLVLSTIAFAEHPYHRLLKDYKLTRDSVNDPVADARIARQLFADALDKLRTLANGDPVFARVVHSLAVQGLAGVSPQAAAGASLVFSTITPASTDLDADLDRLLADRVCATALSKLHPLAAHRPDTHLALLFAIGWLRVAAPATETSRSILMPWVRRALPLVPQLLTSLRDHPCHAPACTWCRTAHDPIAHLTRWFRHPNFRATPTLPDQRPAQRAIVDAGFANTPHLALLPTGGGKSLCFQLPALARYVRRGALTIVISPLQSLMHDQVDNFRARTGSDCAVALTGRLTVPERRAALDAVRSGTAGILYVAPEQLRNATFAQAIALREIGTVVFDEAHCLSKWGHDFRPDYLYAARFLKEFCVRHTIPLPPIVCVTATAKPEVRDELLQHFREELGQELVVFDGHGARDNLELRAEATTASEREQRMCELVAEQRALTPTGTILVYTATRRNAERAAAALTNHGIPAEAFHAGLDPAQKKDVQQRFLVGETRVVCATNAFGMGIDKPDIRRVVHLEVPGSLEAYVQEVGRAGRDGQAADAVLLFAADDVETQFRLAASSRLDVRDLRSILRRVRGLARPERDEGVHAAVCTTGEILRDDQIAEHIDPWDRGAPTKVITAIAWLERGRFLRRDENATTVFQGRPLVGSLAEATQRIAGLDLPPHRQAAWLAVLQRLINSEIDAGLSTDDLLDLPDVIGAVTPTGAGRALLRMLLEMQKARLLSTGVRMTAFVSAGVVGGSAKVLAAAVRREERVLALLREEHPDPEADEPTMLQLAALNQRLLQDDPEVDVEALRTLLHSMSDRAASAGAKAPGLRVAMHGHDRFLVTLTGTWDQIVATAARRHVLAHVCLVTMLAQLTTAKARGKALLVEFGLEQLLAAANEDLELRSAPSPDPAAEIEYALLFLHKIGAIVLHKGLAVFRQAMTLRVPVAGKSRRYTNDDFAPLADHQQGRTLQIHVMAEFAERLVEDRGAALRLLDDYFRLPPDAFLQQWFAGRTAELERPTGRNSWSRIVEGLSRDQRRIVEVADDASLLVLAGPGSGKTRVVVHRCAFLLRVRRVPARSILVLCFNRSAALELRRRLRDLIGEDARSVLVQTYHGMAARLAGRAPAELLDRAGAGTGDPGKLFDDLMAAAVTLLEGAADAGGADAGGDDTGDGEAETLRDRLLLGFRHILVDEYQDIDEMQYRLVAAIAGRTQRDPDKKLAVLAVGDDDQNIYRFRGSDVAFLRRFAEDYGARPVPLVENFRSTAHIIAASNWLIAQNGVRMKTDAPIRIDGARAGEPGGGLFAALGAVGAGRVHVVEVDGADAQSAAVAAELQQLRACAPQLSWEGCAVLARHHRDLDAARTLLEQLGIPVRLRVDRDRAFSLFRMREVQSFLDAVAAHTGAEIDASQLHALLTDLRAACPRERAVALVAETIASFVDEHGPAPLPKTYVREFFGEVLLEQRRERTLGDGVMLGTVHGSKGSEHDHVLLLDGDWAPGDGGTWDEQRRLYYVGMTRARRTLTLVQIARGGAPWIAGFAGDHVHRTKFAAQECTPLEVLHHELLGQQDLWLAFPARDERHGSIDAAIHDLATGDELQFVDKGRRTFLTDSKDRIVGALSDAGTERWRAKHDAIRRICVAAVIVRRAEDEGAQHQDQLRRDTWFVVIPEVAVTVNA